MLHGRIGDDDEVQGREPPPLDTGAQGRDCSGARCEWACINVAGPILTGHTCSQQGLAAPRAALPAAGPLVDLRVTQRRIYIQPTMKAVSAVAGGFELRLSWRAECRDTTLLHAYVVAFRPPLACVLASRPRQARRTAFPSPHGGNARAGRNHGGTPNTARTRQRAEWAGEEVELNNFLPVSAGRRAGPVLAELSAPPGAGRGRS